MNIRPIESWIWSRIKLGKVKDSPRYYTDITGDKLEEWVQHYFDHCLKVRDYFENRAVKNRSKLYVYSIEEKTIKELMKEMGIWKEGTSLIETVDFARSVKLREEEKKFPKNVRELIKMKMELYGDPSKLEWWN
jgi:hypothetical protein